eukprot:6013853-Pleurochrysis_carterae.AAC.1
MGEQKSESRKGVAENQTEVAEQTTKQKRRRVHVRVLVCASVAGAHGACKCRACSRRRASGCMRGAP